MVSALGVLAGIVLTGVVQPSVAWATVPAVAHARVTGSDPATLAPVLLAGKLLRAGAGSDGA